MTGIRGEMTRVVENEAATTDARVHREITQYMMDTLHRDGVYNPLETQGATKNLLEQRIRWEEAGKTVVFTSGVFDLLHPNHRAYLLHTKLEAVPVHFDKMCNQQGAWDQLELHEQAEACADILLQDKIKLIVSVDGDESVADRKGMKEEKGSVQRPIYSWQSRARDVLGANTALSIDGQAVRFPIADAVTIHDGTCEFFANTPHDDIISIARFLQPDVWSIYYESQDIIDRLEGEEGVYFPNTTAVTLPGHEFYTDELLGGRFSTTAISRRLGGAATKNGMA